MDLDAIFTELESMGLDRDPVMELLLDVYAAGELYVYDRHIEREGAGRVELQFLLKGQKEWVVDVLLSYGIARMGAINYFISTDEERVYNSLELSQEAREYAARIFRKRLEMPEVAGILSRYPRRLLRAIALLAAELTPSGDLAVIKHRVLVGVPPALARVCRDPEACRKQIGSGGEYRSKNPEEICDEYYTDTKYSYKKVYTKPAFDIYLADQLMELGRVNEAAVRLFQELSTYKIAIYNYVLWPKSYESRSWGYFVTQYASLHSAYIAPPEVAALLYKKGEDLGDDLRELCLLKVLLHGVKKGELLRLLEALGIPEERIASDVELMRERCGCVSRYNWKGEPESPALIVTDKAKAMEEARVILKTMEDKVLQAA